MEIEEVFKSPFRLIGGKFPPVDSPIRLDGIVYIYRTEKIISSTTTEEIFDLSQMYLKQTIEEFNHYETEPEESRPVITTYRLYIAWEVEKDGLIQLELEEKDLYHITYNIEEEEKYIIEEKKYYLPPDTIKRNFFIYMVPTIYFQDRQTDPDEVEEEYHIKKSIKSTECVICLQNRPNVLYIKCRHIVACDSCDLSGKLLECPICRTKIKDQRMKI